MLLLTKYLAPFCYYIKVYVTTILANRSLLLQQCTKRNVEKPRPLCVGVLMGITGYKKNVYEDFPAALCCHIRVEIISELVSLFLCSINFIKWIFNFHTFVIENVLKNLVKAQVKKKHKKSHLEKISAHCDTDLSVSRLGMIVNKCTCSMI